MFWQITLYSDHISRQSFGDNFRAIRLLFRLTSFPGLFYIPRRIADMTAKLTVTNSSRTHEYAIVLNGENRGEVFPLKATTIEIPPGGYELGFKDIDAGDLPTLCKPIHMTIDDAITLELRVVTKNFSIQIYDSAGTHLNGKHGFLCGRVCEGVRIENPIT